VNTSAPDDRAEHVGFWITFNYGDVWECEDDCPACAECEADK
jgi:hypothetical protein